MIYIRTIRLFLSEMLELKKIIIKPKTIKLIYIKLIVSSISKDLFAFSLK